MLSYGVSKKPAEIIPSETGDEMRLHTEFRETHCLVRSLASGSALEPPSHTHVTGRGKFIHMNDQICIGTSNHNCFHVQHIPPGFEAPHP